MSAIDFTSPREAARAFNPQLTHFVEQLLYTQVWNDPALSKRDRSLITVAALIALHTEHELPAHLKRATDNGVTKEELGALISHLSFYAGLPAAITASAIAAATLGPQQGEVQ